MNMLPRTRDTPLLRTGFADETEWETLWAAVTTPNEDDFVAVVSLVNDRAFADLTTEQLLALAPEDYGHSILIVADEFALASAELPLLVIDLHDERGSAIRVVATELWGIENNMRLANMWFHEFADSVDSDGIFRGF